ncbi:MAG: DUF21 domain-containing protein [Elusimicrobia bacterium]|nr:DUF21 domain-containing protein [Elusimicrobiota bacterium]
MSDWLGLAIAALLLLLNAFFVLAEFAFIKIRPSRVEELARRGGVNAALVKHVSSNIDAYLSTIQLGITMASLGIGWLAEPAIAHLLGPWLKLLPLGLSKAASYSLSFAVAFAFITILHVVVGENAPKLVAIRRPTRAAILTAAPLHLCHKIFHLPMTLLNALANFTIRIAGLRAADPSESTHSDEELKILLAHSQESGALPLSRLLLFENLFDFGYTQVKDVMVKAEGIAWLSLDKPWEENLAVVRKGKFSRYPLCGASLDDVRGIVHFKSLWLTDADENPGLAQLAQPALFFAEETPLERALLDLRQKHTHMALVRDKAGRISGLLTLEDVIEELVGEIRDEFEAPPPSLLSDIIVPQAVDAHLPQAGKAEILKLLLSGLASGRSDISFAEAWDIVWRREQTFNSALGNGIAIFHGRLSNLARPALGLGRSHHGLDFNAPDKKPVHLVFLLLTSIKEPGIHLRLLSRVASLSSEDTFRRSLLHARGPGDILDVLQTFSHSRPT